MRKAVFVLGTPERRAVGKGDMLTDWTFKQLDELARSQDLDASILFAVNDPYLASRSKTELGIARIRQDRPRLLDEIGAEQPEIVLLFGNVAAACVMDKGDLKEDDLQRQELRPFGPDGPPAFFTHSIEQCMMAPGMTEWWLLDLAAAVAGHSKPKVEPYVLNSPECPL